MRIINDKFLAKSNGTTLQKHTADLLEAISALEKVYGNKYPNDWWLALKYAALLHDLGKIDSEFQLKLKFKQHNPTIPHSIFSLFFIKPENFPIMEPESVEQLLISAVAFHHWRAHFPELLLGAKGEEISEKARDCRRDKYFWQERVTKLQDEFHELCEQYELSPDVLGINEVLVEYLSYHNLGQAGLLVPPYTLSFLPARLREKARQTNKLTKLQIFLSGNLMRADHFASLVEDNPKIFNISDIENARFPNYLDLVNNLKAKFNTDYLWQAQLFNDFEHLQGEDLVLVAPTGVGKTEFAYLWGTGKKNIFLLPMRAAVNGIWNRTRKLWRELPPCSEEDIALLHGDASLELFQHTDMDLESEIRPTMNIARQFSHPYIISTADQIVPAALKYPGYERIFATLMNSNLIIDEVQAYDPRAAAIIVYLVKQNYALGGKTLLMTATLPAFIRTEVLGNMEIEDDGEQFVCLIEHPEFEKKARSTCHHIKTNMHYGQYEGCIEKIIAAGRRGKKVLVVANTVKTAVEIYSNINSNLNQEDDIELILLHSRFTEQDRQKKIKEVYNIMANNTERSQRPCIVVSTQIVEASLDLDADVLFTDAAPADSLVQRMGRVFRRFAQDFGNNAPKEPNVIIMVNASHAQNNKAARNYKLAPGVGYITSPDSKAVYDLDLTLLSLLLLKAIADGDLDNLTPESVERLFEQDNWKEFFKADSSKKEQDNKRIKALESLLKSGNNSFILNEKSKMEWVELCYEVLVDANNKKHLFMGQYVDIYYRTLKLLEQGYCTDRKRDAERLFRNVRSITAIPISMQAAFYDSIKKWFNKHQSSINYLNLATEVLQNYTVSVQFWHLDKAAHSLDLDSLLDEIDMELKQRQKIERWLTGLYWIDLDYSYQLGLNDGDKNAN